MGLSISVQAMDHSSAWKSNANFMKRLFLFLLTAVCLFGQSQNVTVSPSPGSGGMNTGTFSTQGINYYLGKTGTTWDFSQVTLILPSSLAFVSTITAGAGINVSQSTGAVTISNTGVLAITPGTGITESIVGGTVTLNNSGVLAITAGNGVSVSGTQANITINAIAAGTVTSVSAVGQNGIGATTTNSTTNPVITLNLGSITPSAVTTGGLATVGSLRTSNLTGYLYGNGASNVTASTTIPSTAITGLATVATTGNYNDLLNKPTLNAGTVTSVATTGSVNGITLTGGTITSSGTITLGGTLSGITNSQLTNNSITIAGTATALGGSISQDTITGLSTTGIVKRTGANTLAIATSGSDYAPATSTTNILYGNGSGGFSPVTVGSGLTFTAGTLASTSGGGSVTTVSVSPNSGVTAGVTNSTTTPTISIGLGAITPTSVTTNTMTFGVNTGVLTVTTGTVGSAAITGSGQAVFNSGPSIAAPTITGAATAVNLTTSGLESVANLKTSGLTGYLYGNSTTNVTASTTIPTSSLSGSVSLTSQVSGILPIANGGTGSSTASLVAGTGIAITGTFPNQTINATGGTGTVTSVSVTGNSGVLAGVATATTTPAISIGLGNITPTSVTSSGTLNISNTTTSTSTTTGAIIDAGGLGVGGNGYFGGYVNISGSLGANSGITLPNSQALYWYDSGGTARLTGLWGGTNNIYYGDIANSNNSNLYLMSGGTGSTHFYNNGSENVTITSAGNVGIGTTSPSAKLTTVSTVGFSAPNLFCTDNVSNFRIIFLPSTYAGVPANKPWLHSYDDIYIGSDAGTSFNVVSSGVNRFKIDSAGNLGLGVTPSAWLTSSSYSAFQMRGVSLFGNSSSAGGFLFGNAYIDSGGTIKYTATAAATGYNFQGGAHVWSIAPSGTAGNAISFTQAMTLDASGQLLLGTTTPVATGAGSLTVGATTASTSTTSGALQVAGGVGVGGALNVGGNVAIGTTPSAWGSYYKAIESYTGTSFCITTKQNDIEIGSNFYKVNSGFADIYATTGYNKPSKYVQDNGFHIWFTAPTGTAGHTIPFTQVMTLDAGGVLQLNTYGAGTLVTNSSGIISASSDVRLKNVKHAFTTGLKAITQIHPAVYSWKSEEKEGVHTTYAGFIAQDVQKAIPEAVGQGKDGYLTLQDRAITAALVNAIKEQQKEIEDLQQQIKQLSKQP